MLSYHCQIISFSYNSYKGKVDRIVLGWRRSAQNGKQIVFVFPFLIYIQCYFQFSFVPSPFLTTDMGPIYCKLLLKASLASQNCCFHGAFSESHISFFLGEMFLLCSVLLCVRWSKVSWRVCKIFWLGTTEFSMSQTNWANISIYIQMMIKSWSIFW